MSNQLSAAEFVARSVGSVLIQLPEELAVPIANALVSEGKTTGALDTRVSLTPKNGGGYTLNFSFHATEGVIEKLPSLVAADGSPVSSVKVEQVEDNGQEHSVLVDCVGAVTDLAALLCKVPKDELEFMSFPTDTSEEIRVDGGARILRVSAVEEGDGQRTLVLSCKKS